MNTQLNGNRWCGAELHYQMAEETKMNKLEFRPFENIDSEYKAIAAIDNANFPDALFTAREIRYYDETWKPGFMNRRIVAEGDGRIVGYIRYGEPWWSFEEGKFFFNIAVHPNWHDAGVAQALFEILLDELQDYQPQQLVIDIREDQLYMTDLLSSQGFEAVMRFPESELDVQKFDASRFDAVCNRVFSSGVRIDDLNHVADEDADWKCKCWNLEWEIVQDVPAPQPYTRMSFGHWQKRVLGSPNFTMAGQMIARDGDRFVGMSGLWTSESEPKKLYTGLTGVLRSYRRQGIATAMKVQGIKFAQANGIEVIVTDNEENNPMLDLNKQLGFEEKPASVSYEWNFEKLEAEKELLKVPV